MHLLLREARSLDEQDQACDLALPPADVVTLSFSDSDLGCLAAVPPTGATLHLVPLARLRHPLSVDLFVESTIAGSRCVFVRLLGGLDYWAYGAEELAACCRRHDIPLAMVAGDARDDPRLAALSTVSPPVLARLDGFLREGGADNHRACLSLLSHLAGRGPDDGVVPVPVPPAGVQRARDDGDTRPLASIVCYRAHVMADDLAPFAALAAALDARGLASELLHVASLKDPVASGFIADRLRRTAPSVVLNATFFSARTEAGSALEAADAPVLQLLQPVAAEALWAADPRGLSQTDLAMQLVLPELDGRLAAGAISFKQFGEAGAATRNMPFADGIALVADRAAGWARLRALAASQRRIAIVLSDYPGLGGQIAQAVGLDSLASLAAILPALAKAGYDLGADPLPDAAALTVLLCHQAAAEVLSCSAYETLLTDPSLRAITQAAWGPAASPVRVRHLHLGKLVIAVQPDRGSAQDRKASYHDPDLPAGHDHVGFHLWLRETLAIDALVQLGTHGTLEWLPGKAAALSASCQPVALLRGLPVIYPFIVNNPGEAAAAKRRLGAVTIGHLTPMLADAELHGEAHALERLIDDFAAADGMDRRQCALLRQDILDRAEACGLLAESGAQRQQDGDDASLARLDAWLCDVKSLRIRDGLHVFGGVPETQATDPALAACGPAEMAALLTALDGRFVVPGPSGAPSRGRPDVLPTGRNLFSIDPRAVPTRTAMLLGAKAATALLDRHRQDQGDWLRTAMLDLWGSTTLRTGGEDFGLALTLMGVLPLWDDASSRVSGFEIIPLALLDRPRVDVSLHISGFFRDAFPGLIALFDQVVTALSERSEDPDWNRLVGAPGRRIHGAAPGCYGTGIETRLARGDWTDRDALGRAWLAGGAYAYGKDAAGVHDPDGFARQVAEAEALVHIQDHAEIDLLDGLDHAAWEGGFAAASNALGGRARLYHADTARPEAPKLRLAGEELARVVRGRAANPDWIAGMRRHGYRGAAEIARTVDSLHGFAALLPERFDRQFDLLFDATLGCETTARFLRDENPNAADAMADRFEEARARGLWRPRRNDLSPISVAAE